MRIIRIVSLALAASLLVFMQVRAAGPDVTVYKDPFCGCCSLWVKHLEEAGFKVTVHEVENMEEPVYQQYPAR